MGLDDIAIQLVDEGNSESAVRFLIEWVSDGEDEARRYLADHVEPDGTSLIATRGSNAVGYVAIAWESNYAGFRNRGIPLVHQIAVGEPWRRRGVATLLMDAAEHLARDRGIATLGITVGLFDEYGPAQRMYGRRGYIPDGRGACQGQRPLSKDIPGQHRPRPDHLAHQGSRQLTTKHRTSSRQMRMSREGVPTMERAAAGCRASR